MKTRNYVAKHLRKFNKPATHKDKKKANKAGYTKHKGKDDESRRE